MTDINKQVEIDKVETNKIFTILSYYNINKETKKEVLSTSTTIPSLYTETVELNDITGGKIKTHEEYINKKDEDDTIMFIDNKMTLEYSSYIENKKRIYAILGFFELLNKNKTIIRKEFFVSANDIDELHELFDKELVFFFRELMETYVW